MVTSKQRREQSRRQLERQLQARLQQEAARKRRTLIATIAGTVILAVVVVVVVIAVTGGKDKKKPVASNPTSSPPAPSASQSVPAPPAAKGPAVTFAGVTVQGAADLGGSPGVTSKSSKDATKLEFKDLIVGKGKAATPKSTVSVQYTGVLYKTGTPFDSSWTKGGQPVSFSLTGVVQGFTQGIGGTTGIPPMKVGGRRIMIVPASLGYRDQANGPIPANSSLVFVVDLKTVS